MDGIMGLAMDALLGHGCFVRETMDVTMPPPPMESECISRQIITYCFGFQGVLKLGGGGRRKLYRISDKRGGHVSVELGRHSAKRRTNATRIDCDR